MADAWDWELRGSAEDTLERLDAHQQDRIISKLDQIVTDEWRTPDEYLDPLTGSQLEGDKVAVVALNGDFEHNGCIGLRPPLRTGFVSRTGRKNRPLGDGRPRIDPWGKGAFHP